KASRVLPDLPLQIRPAEFQLLKLLGQCLYLLVFIARHAPDWIFERIPRYLRLPPSLTRFSVFLRSLEHPNPLTRRNCPIEIFSSTCQGHFLLTQMLVIPPELRDLGFGSLQIGDRPG